MKKIPLLITTLICCSLAAVLWLLLQPPAQTIPISATGGETIHQRHPTPVHYLQTDERWARETIGGSHESIAAVGCTLCSVANALNALSFPLDPAQLNQHLKNNHGYTERGWLEWTAVPHVAIDVYRQPTHRLIDQAIKKGDFPIIKFWIHQSIPHWVTIIGKKGQDYIVLDPLRAGDTLLSEHTDTIHSLRIVRKP